MVRDAGGDYARKQRTVTLRGAENPAIGELSKELISRRLSRIVRTGLAA